MCMLGILGSFGIGGKKGYLLGLDRVFELDDLFKVNNLLVKLGLFFGFLGV